MHKRTCGWGREEVLQTFRVLNINKSEGDDKCHSKFYYVMAKQMFFGASLEKKIIFHALLDYVIKFKIALTMKSLLTFKIRDVRLWRIVLLNASVNVNL